MIIMNKIDYLNINFDSKYDLNDIKRTLNLWLIKNHKKLNFHEIGTPMNYETKYTLITQPFLHTNPICKMYMDLTNAETFSWCSSGRKTYQEDVMDAIHFTNCNGSNGKILFIGDITPEIQFAYDYAKQIKASIIQISINSKIKNNVFIKINRFLSSLIPIYIVDRCKNKETEILDSIHLSRKSAIKRCQEISNDKGYNSEFIPQIHKEYFNKIL